MSTRPLEGYGILVTGGGTGIGKACAARLAADGAVVTICGRTREKLEAVAAALGESGHSVGIAVADVTVEDDVARAVAETVARAGNLRGVMANAGGGGMIWPYHLQELDEFKRVLDLNVVGTMLTIKHSVPHLVASGGGSFVGMSSIAATATHVTFGAYPAAKAAIDTMIRNAADEYGPANVRFNTVQPGFVATEVMEGIPRDSTVFDSYLVNTPLGGISEPEEIASVVSFLIGPDSSRITGVNLAVDGGHHLRRGPDYTPFTGLSEAELLARPAE